MSYRTIQVTAKPQPLYVGQPLKKDSGLGVGWTLANNDQTNPVFVSTTPGVKSTDSDAIQVAPLGSIPIDPTLTSYVVSAGPSVQCFLMPGGGTWAPSPAQVAAQINALGLMKDSTGSAINTNVTGVAKDATVTGVAKDTTLAAQTSGATIATDVFNTGVPLFTKSNSLIDTGAQSIAAAAQFLSSLTSFSQIGYEIFISAVENTTVGATPLNTVSVTLTWVDSVSNKTVDTDTWRVFPGNGIGGSNSYIGAGPTKGDKVQILITNLDTVACTVQVILLQNSRVYARDDVRGAPNVVTGQTLAAIMDIPANFLGSRFVAALGAGATDVAVPAFFAGKVKLHWDSGSNAADCELILTAESLGGAAGGSVVYDKYCDGTGNGNDEFYLARTGYIVSIVNHNAAAKQVRWRATIGEY